jgi:hypothetical protein
MFNKFIISRLKAMLVHLLDPSQSTLYSTIAAGILAIIEKAIPLDASTKGALSTAIIAFLVTTISRLMKAGANAS